jgi:GDP-L-fucose synthase
MHILVFGNGLVGKSLKQILGLKENYQVTTVDRKRCDFRSSQDLRRVISDEKPEVVIIAAGVVGGVQQNLNYPADMIFDNNLIMHNIISESLRADVVKLINIAPSCVYPANLSHRMSPLNLHSGPMESSSLAYSTAKLTGIVMIDAIRKQYKYNWLTVIPTNLYGKTNETKIEKMHVIPSLIFKFQEALAKDVGEVKLLGNGTAIREFMHVDDFSNAIHFLLSKNDLDKNIVNIAWKENITISDLADIVASEIGYRGSYVFGDKTFQGSEVKLLDGEFIQNLGWEPKYSLRSGIRALLDA